MLCHSHDIPMTDKTQFTPTSDEVEVHVDTVTSAPPVSDIMFQRTMQGTAEDVVLQAVITDLWEGWGKGSRPQSYLVRADLSVANGHS